MQISLYKKAEINFLILFVVNYTNVRYCLHTVNYIWRFTDRWVFISIQTSTLGIKREWINIWENTNNSCVIRHDVIFSISFGPLRFFIRHLQSLSTLQSVSPTIFCISIVFHTVLIKTHMFLKMIMNKVCAKSWVANKMKWGILQQRIVTKIFTQQLNEPRTPKDCYDLKVVSRFCFSPIMASFDTCNRWFFW